MKGQQLRRNLRTTLLCPRLLQSLFLALAVSVGALGCTKAQQEPPEAPLKQAKKDSKLEPEQEMDLERRHLAPPPAYGNKVVMAASDEEASTHF